MSAVLSQEGIDSLTRLPKGNAEAELMSVVPVFYVYHYLEAGHNWDTTNLETFYNCSARQFLEI